MTLAIIAVLFAGIHVYAADASWNHGDPVTTYWAGPGAPNGDRLNDVWMAQLKEGGFNTVWAMTVEDLDMAAKYGMRAIYKYKGYVAPIEDPKVSSPLGEEIDRIKKHPALYAYSLIDEPSAELFARLGRTHEWFKRRDPDHAVWVNLLPTYARNNQLGVKGEIFRAYWEYVRLFCETFRPEVFSYDHYQLQNGGDSPDYLLNLCVIRQAASAYGIPFWNGVQACTWRPGDLASPKSPRIPGPDELRFLVYTTAAYGAHGIYYYVYCHKGHGGSIATLDGKTGDKFELLKTLNREFIAIARELAPLTFKGAYVQGRHASGTTPYCEQALLKISPETSPSELQPMQEMSDSILVTRFEAPGRRAYLMVVNLDYRKARELQLEAPSQTERFDAMKGVWLPVGTAFSLALERGGGALLRLENPSE